VLNKLREHLFFLRKILDKKCNMSVSDFVKSLNKLLKNKPELKEYTSTRREHCEYYGRKPVHYKVALKK